MTCVFLFNVSIFIHDFYDYSPLFSLLLKFKNNLDNIENNPLSQRESYFFEIQN